MATSTTKPRTTSTKTKASESPADGAVTYVKQTAERAVDVPVGAALIVAETVKPFTSSDSAQKELKSLRTQVRREFNKLERRGGQARRKLRTRARTERNRLQREVKQRRTRVEREVKRRRATAEKTLKQNRTRVEKAVSDVRDRVGATA